MLEQAPNPYAFSAVKLDRAFELYRKDRDFESAVALMHHLRTFYIVGNRRRAISRNLLPGGIRQDHISNVANMAVAKYRFMCYILFVC